MALTEEKKESLKSYLNGVIEIFFIIKDNYTIAKRFSIPENDMEFGYQNYDMHFRTITFSLWRILIIDMAKLITKGGYNHYNIINLIEEFKLGGKYYSNEITEEDVTDWLKDLERLGEPITNIKIYRDKAYAHTDRDRVEKLDNKGIGVNEFKEIIKVIGHIFQHIYLVIFNTVYSLETPMESKPFLIKERLVCSREKENEDPEYKKLVYGDIKDDVSPPAC